MNIVCLNSGIVTPLFYASLYVHGRGFKKIKLKKLIATKIHGKITVVSLCLRKRDINVSSMSEIQMDIPVSKTQKKNRKKTVTVITEAINPPKIRYLRLRYSAYLSLAIFRCQKKKTRYEAKETRPVTTIPTI
jgi:hypothetical protein